MSRLRKILLGLAIALVSLILVVIVARALVFHHYNVKVAEEIRLLKEEGGEETVAALVAKTRAASPRRLLPQDAFRPWEPKLVNKDVKFTDPTVSEDDKIGSAYVKVWQWRGFQANLWDARDVTKRGRDWNENWLAFLETVVSRNADMLDAIRREEAGGDAAFQTQWSDGYRAMMLHLGRLRSAARIFALEAAVRAHAGDSAGALEDVRSSLRLRRFIDDDPAIISRLVGYAMDTISFNTLHAVLEEGPPDRAGCEAVLRELAGREQDNRLTLVLLGETALGLQLIDEARHDPSLLVTVTDTKPRDISAAGRTALKVLGLGWIVPADKLTWLGTMRGMRESSLAESPFLAPNPAAAFRTHSIGKVPTSIFTQMFAPALSYAFTQEVRADARVAMARTAVELALYRADRGEYPLSLDALVPRYAAALERDPFDGKPIRYARTSQGYIVYCVGDDCVDNGGTPGKLDVAGSDYIWLVGDKLPAEAVAVESTEAE